MVAEPPGPRRQQPLRRRLPRARQHQPDRPLAPAAGHHDRAGRRHGVDGLLLARDARARGCALAERNDVYDDMVVKFLEQFVAHHGRARGVGAVRRRRRLLLRPVRRPRRPRDRHRGADAGRHDPGLPAASIPVADVRAAPRRCASASLAAWSRLDRSARQAVAASRGTASTAGCSCRWCRPSSSQRVLEHPLRRGRVPLAVRPAVAVEARTRRPTRCRASRCA